MFIFHSDEHRTTPMASGNGEKRKRDDYGDETIRQNSPKRICVVDRWTDTRSVDSLTNLMKKISMSETKCPFQPNKICPYPCPYSCSCPFQCPMDTIDLVYNANLDTDMDCHCSSHIEQSRIVVNGCFGTDMDYELSQTEPFSHLVADRCLGMSMEYPHGQTEQSNLAAEWDFGTEMDYSYLQDELTANGSFSTDIFYTSPKIEHFEDVDNNVSIWNAESLKTSIDQGIDVCSRSTFWKPLNIEEKEKEESKAKEEIKDEKEKEEEEEEELSEVLLKASEKYSQTMEALDVDPNLSDVERKSLMEKTTEEYMKVIRDNPLTNSDLTLEDTDEPHNEDEDDDDEEDEDEEEDKDEDEEEEKN